MTLTLRVPVPASIGIPFDGGQWTDRTLDALRRLWDMGYSTASIAEYLRFSKNATVGKAHRLGLPPRPSPIKWNGGSSQPSVPRVTGSTLPPLRPANWATVERRQLLIEWVPTYVPWQLLFDQVAALGDVPCPDKDVVGTYARHSLKLRRPEDIRENFEAVDAADRAFRLEMGLPEQPPKVRFRPVVRLDPIIASPRAPDARPRLSRAIRVREPVPMPLDVPVPYVRAVKCQWLDGDIAPWIFCEAPTVHGGSWCAAHRAICFVRQRETTYDKTF